MCDTAANKTVYYTSDILDIFKRAREHALDDGGKLNLNCGWIEMERLSIDYAHYEKDNITFNYMVQRPRDYHLGLPNPKHMKYSNPLERLGKTAGSVMEAPNTLVISLISIILRSLLVPPQDIGKISFRKKMSIQDYFHEIMNERKLVIRYTNHKEK